MSPLSQQNESQAGDCSNIEDRQPRTHDRRSASSSSAHLDQSAQVIAVVAQTQRNELQCRNLANTREQLRVAIERRVDRVWDWQPMENIMKKRHDVVIFPPVADEPLCSI